MRTSPVPRRRRSCAKTSTLGRDVDVQGTPTFFINGKRVPGTNRSLEGMKAMVDEALKKDKG